MAILYIPPGCIVGFIFSFIVSGKSFVPAAAFIITIITGLITYCTVKISIRKPAKIATKISPIEALYYSPYTKSQMIKKKSVKLSPKSLAKMNLFRSKKKSILTFVSLTLSGLLLMGVSTVLASLNPEARAKQSFPYGGEFVVEINRALLSETVGITNLQENNPLTDVLQNELETIEGVKAVIVQKEIAVSQNGIKTTIKGMNTNDCGLYQKHLIDGLLPDPASSEKNALIINADSPEMKFLGASYHVGDRIHFLIYDGNKQKNVEFTVTAVLSDKNSSAAFILPEAAMDRLVNYNSNCSFVVLAESRKLDKIENNIRNLIFDMDILRVKTLREQTMFYKSVFWTISAAAYTLILFILIFSIINLLNTFITDILSRKKEFGLLRAVGLGKKQLCSMISIGNLYQTFGSFLVSIVLGTVLGKVVCSFLQKIPGFGFVQYSFPIGGVIFYLPVILFLQSAIIKGSAHYFRKMSVVEQIRENDG